MDDRNPLYTEEGWFRALRSPEFIAYLAISRPPSEGRRAEVLAARDRLWATPLIRDLLATQRPEGDWPPSAPFRQWPIPLTVLCDAGLTLDDEPVRRASRRLLAGLEGGVFRNPVVEPGKPPEHEEAYCGHCLEALAKSGLGGLPRMQRAVSAALERQRADGGWGACAGGDPAPSCAACTAAMIRGLGGASRLPVEAVERIMAYRLDERGGDLAASAIPELLLQLEFLARQGRRRGDPHVTRLQRRLQSARDEHGRFAAHEGPRGYYPAEYTRCQSDYLGWWLG